MVACDPHMPLHLSVHFPRDPFRFSTLLHRPAFPFASPAVSIFRFFFEKSSILREPCPDKQGGMSAVLLYFVKMPPSPLTKSANSLSKFKLGSANVSGWMGGFSGVTPFSIVGLFSPTYFDVAPHFSGGFLGHCARFCKGFDCS